MGTILTPQSEQKTNKTWEQSWDCPNAECEWSNFSAEQIRKFENDCETQFNTNEDVQKCVKRKKAGSVGGDILNAGLDWFNNRPSASGNIDTTTTLDTDYDKKSNTGLWVGLGIFGAVGVGVAIWYFGFKKN